MFVILFCFVNFKRCESNLCVINTPKNVFVSCKYPSTQRHYVTKYNLQNKLFRLIKWGNLRDMNLYEHFKAELNVPIEGETPLTYAIRLGKSEVVNYLLQEGAETKNIQGKGCTLLALAVHLGHLDIVKIFLNESNLNETDCYGSTPLTIASKQGHFDVFLYLLFKGADINKSGINGETPLLAAAKINNLQMVKTLLSKGAEVNATDLYGKTALIYAAQGGCYHTVKCLLEHGASINKVGNEMCLNGRNALVSAVIEGHLDVVKVLVSSGADVNEIAPDGNSPIAHAIKNKQKAVATYLVEKGANVCKRSDRGKTPLSWAVLNQDFDMIEWLLEQDAEVTLQGAFFSAIETGNLPIATLLKIKGADVNLKNSIGTAPLKMAIQNGDSKIARYLVENGATFANAFTEIETTYHLDKAIESKDFEIVNLIVENTEINWNLDNRPLQTAIETENLEMVRYLVEHGAPVNTLTRRPRVKPPLVIAAINSDRRIFDYLISTGANFHSQIPNIDDLKLSNEEFVMYLKIVKARLHSMDGKQVF